MATLVLPESIVSCLEASDSKLQTLNRRWPRSPGHGLACLLLAQLLTACSSSSDSAGPQPVAVVPAPPVPPPIVTNKAHGHYRGVATVDGGQFHSEVIIAADGDYRIYIGSPVNAGSGLLGGAGVTDDLLDPASSMQVFGHLGTGGNEKLGDGMIVGQICSSQGPGRFCGENTEVEIEITDVSGGNLAGEIRIPGAAGDEIWVLDVSDWSIYYRSRANVAYVAGTYVEVLAPFVQDDEVIVAIDATGGLFFQDAASGCTGNGSLRPHLDGGFYVFDVALTIGNCNSDYDYLNSDAYVGLATETQNNYWGYDSWMLLIVAAPGWESPAAITMYANRY
ncbi:MAG TPA: hypothetical protein VLB07_02570 [Woeseiaceae bacterium]|nr:hypothetical protein [Woeseiaceae bacterium]